MVTMSDTAAQALATATPVAANPNNQEMKSNDSTPKVSSDYEKCREERIRQNLERMQKLGIYDLSLKLKSIKPNTYRKNNKPLSTDQKKTPNPCISPLPSSIPTRRSSRLHNTPAVSYSEVGLSKKGKDDDDALVMENSRPEVYTEEHEMMLGDSKMKWTLFVDGYGKDGKKIYDQVRGKTCHQCRQKTLGHRTRCCKCDLVQGQFCGDCLYMRYGENVLEAMQNPDWICPVCRGICNCSLCRQAKGWAPTGVLYRKISSLGYRSVAHYLIQTRRSDSNPEKNEKTETPVCAKGSLSFSREEIESEDTVATNEEIKDENPTGMQSLDEPLCNIVKPESAKELKDKNADVTVDEDENKNKVSNNMESESGVHLQLTECKDGNADNEVKNSIVTPETTRGSGKKRRAVLKPALENGIAGRLRSRRKCT